MNDAPPPLSPLPPQTAVTVNYPPPRRSSCCGLPGIGCGLGCLVVVALCLAGLVFVGIAGKNWVDGKLVEYTTTQSSPVIQPVAAEAEISQAIAKFDAFRIGLTSGGTPVPLNLTGEELNLLFWHHPESELAGKTQVSIDGDVLNAQVSLSFDELPLPEGYLKEKLAGRHFAGLAGVKIGMVAGRPALYVESLSINGAAIPDLFLADLKTKNLFEEAMNNPEAKAFLEKVEDIRVEGGRLVIQPKSAP